MSTATEAPRRRDAALLGELRPGDTLVPWRLDRLGRSLAHLVGLVSDLGSAAWGSCR